MTPDDQLSRILAALDDPATDEPNEMMAARLWADVQQTLDRGLATGPDPATPGRTSPDSGAPTVVRLRSRTESTGAGAATRKRWTYRIAAACVLAAAITGGILARPSSSPQRTANDPPQVVDPPSVPGPRIADPVEACARYAMLGPSLRELATEATDGKLEGFDLADQTLALLMLEADLETSEAEGMASVVALSRAAVAQASIELDEGLFARASLSLTRGADYVEGLALPSPEDVAAPTCVTTEL